MQNSVELIGYYGSDQTHALSAWTSTSRDLAEKAHRIPELLNKLASEGHHTPFEKSMLHFLVTCDTASHIHLLKHRIGVSVNGESARYKELKEDKYYIPQDWPEDIRAKADEYMQTCYKTYHGLLALLEPTLGRKRAKESARFVLPYANQLTLDVSFNFRSFMWFLGLRKKDQAQDEIHSIADQMLYEVQCLHVFDKSLSAFGYPVHI